MSQLNPLEKRQKDQVSFIKKLAEMVKQQAQESGQLVEYLGDFCIVLVRSIVSFAGGKSKFDFPDTDAEKYRNEIFDEISRFIKIESEKAYLIRQLLMELAHVLSYFTIEKYSRDYSRRPEEALGSEGE